MSNRKLVALQVELARSAHHMGLELKAIGMTVLADRWFATATDHLHAARQNKADEVRRHV